MEQEYFTEEDIGEIVKGIMTNVSESSLRNDQRSAATIALRSVGLLKGRLETSKELLKTVYMDEKVSPKPVIKLVRDYLSGKLQTSDAERILDGLQTDMKAFYAKNKIPYADPAKLHKISIFDPAEIPGLEFLEGMTRQGILAQLGGIISGYDPKIDAAKKAGEMYAAASCEITSEVGIDKVAERLADFIFSKSALSLVARIGMREPTREELAVEYFKSLSTAYERLNISEENSVGILDRDKVLAERTTDKAYQHGLKSYREGLDNLLLGGKKK